MNTAQFLLDLVYHLAGFVALPLMLYFEGWAGAANRQFLVPSFYFWMQIAVYFPLYVIVGILVTDRNLSNVYMGELLWLLGAHFMRSSVMAFKYALLTSRQLQERRERYMHTQEITDELVVFSWLAPSKIMLERQLVLTHQRMADPVHHFQVHAVHYGDFDWSQNNNLQVFKSNEHVEKPRLITVLPTQAQVVPVSSLPAADFESDEDKGQEAKSNEAPADGPDAQQLERIQVVSAQPDALNDFGTLAYSVCPECVHSEFAASRDRDDGESKVHEQQQQKDQQASECLALLSTIIDAAFSSGWSSSQSSSDSSTRSSSQLARDLKARRLFVLRNVGPYVLVELLLVMIPGFVRSYDSDVGFFGSSTAERVLLSCNLIATIMAATLLSVYLIVAVAEFRRRAQAARLVNVLLHDFSERAVHGKSLLGAGFPLDVLTKLPHLRLNCVQSLHLFLQIRHAVTLFGAFYRKRTIVYASFYMFFVWAMVLIMVGQLVATITDSSATTAITRDSLAFILIAFSNCILISFLMTRVLLYALSFNSVMQKHQDRIQEHQIRLQKHLQIDPDLLWADKPPALRKAMQSNAVDLEKSDGAAPTSIPSDVDDPLSSAIVKLFYLRRANTALTTVVSSIDVLNRLHPVKLMGFRVDARFTSRVLTSLGSVLVIVAQFWLRREL